MKKVIKIFGLVVFVFVSFLNIAKAEVNNVNLTIRDGSNIVFSGSVPLQSAGTINLNDTNGNPHPLDANSVLSILNDADILSSAFQITDLEYYDSYGSFYLKCINSKCDNWQYVVDDTAPGIGMDKKILSGGESIYLYFSPQHQITLDQNSLTNEDTLVVSAKNYAYQDNTWEPLNNVTVGLIQGDPFSPTEVMVNPVDENGQATFVNIPVGTYNVGIKEDYYFPTESLTVTEAPPHSHSSGSIVQTISSEKIAFDSKKAYEFLISQQKENGSWGADLYTDWVAVALGTSPDYQEQKNKLIKYENTVKTNDYQLTDYERHSIGLMALGINPQNVNGENYIKKITDTFDGKQFGDKEADNDDIFALIVLQNINSVKNENIIKSTIDFILSKQKENGSWDNSVDMTGAAIQAIAGIAKKNCSILGSLSGVATQTLALGSSACETPQNKEFFLAISKAKEYLKQNQKDDGSFGNVSSTAWAMGGILSLGEKPVDWVKNNNTPLDYLAQNQDINGSIINESKENKLWGTAYALSALSGKTWKETMQKFDEPIMEKEIVIEKKENIKPEIKKIITKTKKINLAKEMTSSPINATDTQKLEPVKKQNWFRRLINNVFGF